MAETVIFQHLGKTVTVSFKQRNACLPVLMKNGQCQLVKWGKREGENCELPNGGWAKLYQIKNEQHSVWHLYKARPVKIVVQKFAEVDFEGKLRWYEIIKGRYIQGVVINEGNDYRVYIVTIDPKEAESNHYRWPQVMTHGI